MSTVPDPVKRDMRFPGEAADIIRSNGNHGTYPRGKYAGAKLRELLGTAPRPIHFQPAKCTRHCKGYKRVGVWALRINPNGREIATLRCLDCGGEMRTIAAHKIADLNGSLLWGDHRREEPCERCGSTDGTEDHHWAPKHLFADPDWWPHGDLCVGCHADWHHVMTPYKSQYRNVEATMGELRNRPARPMHTWWPAKPDRWACQHCNDRHDLVEHSWAPADVFHDSASWPCSTLCRSCSAFWGDVLALARAGGAL